MKQSAKVLSFPSDHAGNGRLKGFGVVFHLALAYMLTLGSHMSPMLGLEILFILGLLYGLFIRHRIEKSRYWRDNKIMVLILLGIFMLAFYPVLLPILALCGLYWLMIGRAGREPPYFLRFHMLTALILNLFILMTYSLLTATLDLVFEILRLADLSFFLESVLALAPFVFMGVFWGAAIWLSISMLMGRTPYIPAVTGNVRYWA